MSKLTIFDCETPRNAKLAIFGAPFDSTTSYRPGTRFAYQAIASQFFGIESYSPYLNKDLLDYSIMDHGELELPFGNSRKALDQIKHKTEEIINQQQVPLMIGGEHLVTLGSVEAIVKHYPQVRIIHFDAHADLRNDYLDEPLSHACVLRRCHELIGDHRIFQFGIRSMSKDEHEFAQSHVTTQRYQVTNLPAVVEQLKGYPVYVTIDLDVLDPSVFPGTGTPEPGGISFNQLLEAIHSLNSLNIVGADINELSPHYDQSGVSTIIACKVLRELALTII
jgi:agmatinase